MAGGPPSSRVVNEGEAVSSPFISRVVAIEDPNGRANRNASSRAVIGHALTSRTAPIKRPVPGRAPVRPARTVDVVIFAGLSEISPTSTKAIREISTTVQIAVVFTTAAKRGEERG